MARKRKTRKEDINRRGVTEFTLTTVAYFGRARSIIYRMVDLSGIIR